MVEAIVLARLGARIATHERDIASPDEVSRKALTRYLELMPDDIEVRQALDRLGTGFARPRRKQRRWLLWTLFIISGISTAGAIHLNGLPLPAVPPPMNVTVVRLKAKPIAPPVVSDDPPIIIRAVGDVVLGSDFPVYRLPGESDKKRIAALHNSLTNADVVVGNLEGVLYDYGKSRKDPSRSGLFTFRMPESYAATLREMGFDVLSLANNHSMDFGKAGLEATIRALTAEGIHPVGVPGAEMASIKVRNTTIAFLNYSYLSTFVRLDDEQRIKEEIDLARSKSDMVVVTVHAGREGASAAGSPNGDEYFMNEYRGNIRKFAQFAIDSGASAVFGHGPHVVRPYEIYKDKPIFFSLGNFVGYRSLSTKGKLSNSIIAEVRFSPKGKLLGAGIMPLKLDKFGIPTGDYSMTTLATLEGLLDKQLEKRPVLELVATSTNGQLSQAQSSPAMTATPH